MAELTGKELDAAIKAAKKDAAKDEKILNDAQNARENALQSAAKTYGLERTKLMQKAASANETYQAASDVYNAKAGVINLPVTVKKNDDPKNPIRSTISIGNTDMKDSANKGLMNRIIDLLKDNALRCQKAVKSYQMDNRDKHNAWLKLDAAQKEAEAKAALDATENEDAVDQA